MKISFFLNSLILLLQFYCRAQSFQNGSFEAHSFSICSINVADTDFNGKLANVKAFGKKLMWNNSQLPYHGRTCIQDSGCFIQPQQGKWCLGLRSSFGPASDAVSMELDSPLDSGTTYYLSFYLYGNTGFRNFECDLHLGESLYDSIFGTLIYTVTPVYLSWTNVNFSFVATKSSKYITAKTIEGFDSWNQVDNFIISKSPIPLNIQEYNAENAFQFYPNPASKQLNLKFANAPPGYFLEVYDQLGKTVLPKQFLLSKQTELDISSLTEGLYNLRVSNGITSTCKKLVIIK